MAGKNYSFEDIVDYSMQDNPTKVMDAFNSLIAPKVMDGLAAMKQQVASNYMNASQATEEDFEDDIEETE